MLRNESDVLGLKVFFCNTCGQSFSMCRRENKYEENTYNRSVVDKQFSFISSILYTLSGNFIFTLPTQ